MAKNEKCIYYLPNVKVILVCRKQISKSCSGLPANSIQNPWGFKLMDHVIDPLKAKRSPKKAYKNSHEYILDFKSLKVVDKIVDDVEKAKKGK